MTSDALWVSGQDDSDSKLTFPDQHIAMEAKLMRNLLNEVGIKPYLTGSVQFGHLRKNNNMILDSLIT